MEQKPIRFGILGCGLAGGFHAAAIRAVEGAELRAVCDVTPESARAFAAKYRCGAYGDIEAFANDEDIDAVCVCTPSGYHAENAVFLLERNKHLIIEKPLAVDLRQAQSIVDAAKKSGRTVASVAQLRCCKDVRRLKDILASGVIGRPVSAQLSMIYHRDEAYYKDSGWHGTLALDGGGALINQGIHGVDLLLWLLGPVRRVSAAKATLRHEIEAEDTLAALLEFENGCLCTLSAATSVSHGQPRTLTVFGTQGSAVLTEDRLTSLVTEEGGLVIETGESAYLSHADPGAIPEQAHQNVIRDFCEALNENRRPISDVIDGCNALALIRAAYDATEKGPQTPVFTEREDRI
ncbi:MAG: Gfo/Idh/MocA family oxidoreductase [Clostridia bacterium]|nr:Gfo/Idh/MocA family oxidoreductase [Clostridia bacterium]